MRSPVALVVEDEDAVRHLTARVLEDAGFRTREADSAEAALALLGALKDTVGLVVSDVSMPGIGGLGLAAVMAEGWPSTPILLMSGYGGPGFGYAGAFLAKPFTAEALLDAVAGLVPLPSPSPLTPEHSSRLH
jgi:DNA-binding NtrC family response regulator